MSAAVPRLARNAPLVSRTAAALGSWWRAIASLGPAPWKWAALLATTGLLLECALSLADLPVSVPPGTTLKIFAASGLCWGLHAVLGLCAWAIADRCDVPASSRPRRLAVALCVAVGMQAAIGPELQQMLIGRLDPCTIHSCEGKQGKDWSKVPAWLMDSEQSGQTLIFGGLLFAWLEILRRNREIEARLMASQQARARLQRANFEAQLTAMQAQVDPQYLFDCLADVKAAYQIDTARGTELLDRLIVYLRAALPRLRSRGSTIGAEAGLVGAWLDVTAARCDGRPSVRIDVAPDCVQVPFCPTLLLPLVQWLLGALEGTAEFVSVQVRREPTQGPCRIQAQLAMTPAPAQPLRLQDPVPARLRERLQALYGEAARIDVVGACCAEPSCGTLNTGAACVNLSWPDESSNSDCR